MRNNLLYLFLALLFVAPLTAQVNISGSLTFGAAPGQPLPDFPVEIQAEDQVIATGVSDFDGNYSFDFDTIIGEDTEWIVGTFDLCTGDVVVAVVSITEDTSDYTADLAICTDFTPPPPPDTCVAFFEFYPIEEDPFTFQFENYSTLTDPLDSLVWDFGDGTTSNEENPTHTYETAGTYIVTLTIYSGDCTNQATNVLIFFDPSNCECDEEGTPICVVDFLGNILTFPNECTAICAGYDPATFFECDGDCVCPTFVAPICVVDMDGDTITFTNHCFAECEGYGPEDWIECEPTDNDDCDCDFEDEEFVCVEFFGITITFPNACVALCEGFTDADFVECDDTGNCNCPEYYEPVCVIADSGDTLTFSNPCFANCEGYFPDQFIDCFEDPDGCVCDTVWDPVCVVDPTFGDTITFGNACEAACFGFTEDQFVECSEDDCFCTEEYFPVCLVDSTGQVLESYDNICFAICAGANTDELVPCFEYLDCIADFSSHPTSNDGLSIQFQDASFFFSSPVETWSWDFGDGNTSTEQNPLHVYEALGDYTVTLTITGPECTDTITRTITLAENDYDFSNNCQAFFFFEQPDPDNLLLFQFINFSFGSFDEISWDFGDGNTSTEFNPLHTYAEEGTYTVTLSGTGPDGCTSTVAIPVVAGENIWYGDLECRAWFLPIIIPDSNQVFFLNLSSNDALTFAWDFGDGNTSTERDPAYTYAAAGVYTVSLTITTENGCENTFTVTIDIVNDNFTSNPIFSLLSSTTETAAFTGEVLLFPNPTRDAVTVRWDNPADQVENWTLFDLSGKRIIQSVGPDQNGQQIDLDLSQQPAGIYVLRLQTKTGVATRRITKN